MYEVVKEWVVKGTEAPITGHNYLVPASHSGKPESFRVRKKLCRKKDLDQIPGLDSHTTAFLFILQFI